MLEMRSGVGSVTRRRVELLVRRDSVDDEAERIAVLRDGKQRVDNLRLGCEPKHVGSFHAEKKLHILSMRGEERALIGVIR